MQQLEVTVKVQKEPVTKAYMHRDGWGLKATIN